MHIHQPVVVLGGLSPAQFMRRHWQKAPLLVRQAMPGVMPPLPRRALFELAARDDVQSRLIVHHGERWTLRHGPLPRRALPPLKRPQWTLLVQGLDLHVPAAHALLSPFRFVPNVRLDDLMVSYASDRGGVGPHLDSYDVFLLQVQGRRRWRIGRVKRPLWVQGVPLKLLSQFEPTEDWLLEPGDLLYLPPGWGHDGVAQGECMTCSIGLRAPHADALARELLLRLADGDDADRADAIYRDPSQAATATPGRIPEALATFAGRALQRVLRGPQAIERVLGEVLSEPKPDVWFHAGERWRPGHAVVLDRRTRMLYDARHVFINGESFRAAGRDARWMRRLADVRMMSAADVAALSEDARVLLVQWATAGWVRPAANEAS